MAIRSSILVWRMPWTEESDGLQSMGSQRVRHNRATEHARLFKSEPQKGSISPPPLLQSTSSPLVCMCAKLLQSCPTLCNPWTVARQASLSMGFSRQEYWSGLPCTPPGDIPDPKIELTSARSPVLASRFFTTSTIWQQVDLNDALTVFTDLTVISHLDDTRGLNFGPSSTLVL